MNIPLSAVAIIIISMVYVGRGLEYKEEPDPGLEERFAKLEEQIVDLKKRLFLLENPRSIEDDVKQNQRDIMDIRINEVRILHN